MTTPEKQSEPDVACFPFMNKLKFIMLFFVGLAIGSAVAWQCTSAYYIRRINQMYVQNSVVQANIEMDTLRHLRSGDVTNAIEKLELDLDWALIGMTPYLATSSQFHLGRFELKSLREVSEYRATFPRKTGKQVDNDVAEVFALLSSQPKPSD
jgi:hypothetical protein